ncbi:MAG: serine/threonine protein kinase [Deltaproteobacteria bacterium]|nr:serine/threonine protein kinase [Deltaproteobacteria bacterium]
MVNPIEVADVVLDAALASNAETVRIEPSRDCYTIAVARAGELLACSAIDDVLARDVIARLGFVCNVDSGGTGRTRVRSRELQRDVVLTVSHGERPSAELLVLAGDAAGRELVEGDRIGHYRVVAPIGAGGMGDVYEAVHETLGRRHAIKVLARRAQERDRLYVERFVREAQAVARLRHPHIVEIYDFGYLPDRRPYLVMELLGGVSLGDVLMGGPLPPSAALSVASQLAEALAAAHARGVVHGDVTPSNVLLDDGHVTLIDFGLAQLREATMSSEPADEVYGTPHYIAPEQVRGYGATEMTDQYAFGIVVHEMLAGRVPFAGVTTHDTCVAHLHAPVPALESPFGTLSPRLDALIRRCLAKNAADRWPTMQAVAAELGKLAKVAS